MTNSKTISNKENSNPNSITENKKQNHIAFSVNKNNPFKSSSNNAKTNNDQTRRFRRTLSFINTKRKRATQFCSVNKATANRRLSLNPSKKPHLSKSALNNKETRSSESLENSFCNSLPTDEEFKAKDFIQNRRFSNFNPTTSFSSSASTSSSVSSRKSKFKSIKFRLKKRNNYEATLQLLQKQTLFDIDQRLKDYIQNQADISVNSSLLENEELNNKIDLEIRILDGILKLLNAICSSSSLAPASLNPSNQNASNQNNTNASSNQNSVASLMITTLDISKIENVNKCSTVGAEIAKAIMTNRLPTDNSTKANSSNGYTPYTTTASGSSSSSTVSTVSSSVTLPSIINSQVESTDSIFQILSACKCLYVSHRKIAIYLQNLQELEKNLQSGRGNKKINLAELVNSSSENLTENSLDSEKFNNIDKNGKDTIAFKKYNSSQKPKAPLANLTLNNSLTKPSQSSDENIKRISVEIGTTKLMLKDIRIPLVWKWNEHLKAIKNSENVSAKFATFAIIHLGNMIYDTQLISNIDPSITDISFNETFIFDDVRQNDFEITIEFYSYELFNTGNNILQSAKKLAKTLTDFATFKRNDHNRAQLQQQQSSISSFNTLPAQSNSNSSSNYSYSMHKFKLIARAKLNTADISENVETKPLQIINESNLDQTHSNHSGSSNGNINIQNSNSAPSTLSSATPSNNSTHSATTKLPLFDFFSCCLSYAPTSTYI